MTNLSSVHNNKQLKNYIFNVDERITHEQFIEEYQQLDSNQQQIIQQGLVAIYKKYHTEFTNLVNEKMLEAPRSSTFPNNVWQRVKNHKMATLTCFAIAVELINKLLILNTPADRNRTSYPLAFIFVVLLILTPTLLIMACTSLRDQISFSRFEQRAQQQLNSNPRYQLIAKRFDEFLLPVCYEIPEIKAQIPPGKIMQTLRGPIRY